MDMNISILSLASRLAHHSAYRQKVLSENIAHSDTPGYRARDIKPFSEAISSNSMPAFSARVSRPGHIPFGADPNGYRTRELAAFGAETPNGNTVSLEDQTMRATQARRQHDLAVSVYRKTLDIMRTSLGK